MSKTKNPIKFIYATKLDNKTLKFITEKLNVVKECSSYIALEGGSRITTDYIYDLFEGWSCDYYERDVISSLGRERTVYTLKPISKKVKDEVKKVVIENLKEDIEAKKRYLANVELDIKQLKEQFNDRIAKKEDSVKELNNEIVAQQIKLNKLLKL